MTDIETLQDCRNLVERFYAAARADGLLGPVFEARLRRSWPEHLETMTRFWGTVLLAQALYQGRSVVERHAGLPVTAAHFDRWLALWEATVDAVHAGPRAAHAKRAAARMAVRLTIGSVDSPPPPSPPAVAA